MWQSRFGFILYVMLMFPPLVKWMESIMITHMLVQIPLLIVAGYMMGQFLQKKFPGIFSRWNDSGIPGMLLFVIITTYWMLPRIMDETLAITSIELFKFISLPFLAGVPLRDSWRKIGGLGKSFILLNYIPMFAFMAWLYIDAPIQICNNYLETEQKHLGWGFLLIMLMMISYLVQSVFVDQSESEEIS